VPGIRNALFGGDGIFLASLTGPGTVWLQTLPISRLAHQIAEYLPGEGNRANQVAFSMDAGLVKDNYELAYKWAPDGLSVSWTLVSGQMQKAQQGSYVLKPTAKGTEVTYTLAVDLAVPMIGVLRRKAERVILDTALKELRKRVEAG